jgi:hypothetical protein
MNKFDSQNARRILRYFEDGMLATEGIWPMGMGLQDPLVIWRPLVIGTLGVRAQALAKLFFERSAAV